MDSQKKEGESSGDFGKVVEELHNKNKLSALRTYQGDMAQFIKEKNESVISVKLKEKERKERRADEALKNKEKAPKSSGSNFQVNLTMTVLSLALLIAGVSASLYVLEFISKPTPQIKIETDIIPYNSLTTVANASPDSLSVEISKLPPPNGIDLIKISDRNGKLINSAKDFFDFLGASANLPLYRTLTDKFVLGRISQGQEVSLFAIFLVDDFGVAFSSMLDWEKDLPDDFSFLMTESGHPTGNKYEWRDIIVKNKDVRAAVDAQNNAVIAYTFLDRKTILVAGDISALGDIVAIFVPNSTSK